MPTLCVLPNDPLYRYYEKGELKTRYWNPCEFFDEIHVISLADEDVEAEKVQVCAGRAQLSVHPVGRPSAWSLFSTRARVLELVRDIRPSVIRAYNPLLMGWYAVYCGQQLRIPTVLSVHQDYGIWRQLRLTGLNRVIAYQGFARLLRHEHYTLTRADRIICAYAFPQQYIARYRKHGVQVIYNRVDLDRFQPIQRDARDRTVRILCVGVHIPGKEPSSIIQALKRLDAHLTIIGHGPLTGSLRTLAHRSGLERSVTFIDAVPHQRIHEYYASHDVFAISISYPGVCIPVLEAMASGLPVVINKPLWEDEPEVIGSRALVVENTSEGYRAAFQRLIAFPALRQELGAAGRERVLQYDGRVMEQKEQEMYAELVASTE